MKIAKRMAVIHHGSRIVGSMASETPFITFMDSSGKKYYWTSDNITVWEHGLWDRWDKRHGHKVLLRKGTRLFVSAFVRPDQETLYRVDLTANFK